jgi:hypothetical protein
MRWGLQEKLPEDRAAGLEGEVLRGMGATSLTQQVLKDACRVNPRIPNASWYSLPHSHPFRATLLRVSPQGVDFSNVTYQRGKGCLYRWVLPQRALIQKLCCNL